MTICDKCGYQSGTTSLYLFGRFNRTKYTYELCEPCAKELEQKIKEFIRNENV